MSLASGTVIGAYRVVEMLGQGGMGEVYRARDVKLERDVAIKVLPALFAQDVDRLARFAREAKALASLNHPNIAAIHGFEDSGATHALVMELVEGEDLAARIAGGPIPRDEALPIARQIAEALEAAHEQGIIHRDLKPANIKVRADGTVKVLDFGLAKALTPDLKVGPTDANSPTIVGPTFRAGVMMGTQMGMILGTAAYMAPEQAKGKAVDKRADIWAFGVVVFEMVTGERLFPGETVSDTLAAVLRQDVPFNRLPAGLPASLRRLLMRCLERDPKQRLRDIGEARIVLASPPEPAEAAGAVAAPAPARSGLPRLGWLAIGLVAGAGLGALAGSSQRAESAVAEPFTLRRLTNLPGPEREPDLSPDGKQVVYSSAAAGNDDIYLLRVGGSTAINLTGNSPADDGEPAFSPAGDQIAFRSERDGGGLFVMGATGESVRRLTSAGFNPAWSPDGSLIAYSTEGVVDPYVRNVKAELWTVVASTGEAKKLYAGDAVHPAWSPDGKRIAFWANAGGQRDIWTISATGGAPSPVTSDVATDWSPVWSADGRWLYFVSDRGGGAMNLWRVAIDQSTGSASGAPEQVTNGTQDLGYVKISADGKRMVVAGNDNTYDLSVYDFDPAHPERLAPRRVLRNQALQWCRLSPDGLWLSCTSRGSAEDLVLLRTDGSETRRLTDDTFKDRLPIWLNDSRTLHFKSTRSGSWEHWSIRADGSDLRRLSNFGGDFQVAAVSPDGRDWLLSSDDLKTLSYRYDGTGIATRAKATLLPLQSFAPLDFSPDMAFASGYVTDAAGNATTAAILTRASNELRTVPVRLNPLTLSGTWLPSSRAFVIGGRIKDGAGLIIVDAATGAVRLLKAGSLDDSCVLSADGRTLLIQHPVHEADVWLMEKVSK